MAIKTCNFNLLRKYTKQKAKKITRKPVKVTLVDKFSGKKAHKNTVARHYKIEFIPYDKTIPPSITSYEIELKREYYNKYRNNPHELKNCIAHELAHCKVTKHNKEFKKVAKCLGADNNHSRANWD